MTRNEAKEILIQSRFGRSVGANPRLPEALALAEKDPALQRWLEQQRSFHDAASRSLRSMPVPPDLRDQLLASRATKRSTDWWRQPTAWSAAALFIGLLTLGLWWSKSPAENTLATFQSRMVGAVLRQYTMDIVTNDMTQVRAFLATKSAPADYTIPDKLSRLPVSGGGVLSWQGGKVSMVCFDSPQQGTLFLFIVNGSSLQDPPAAPREFRDVNKLGTISWMDNGRTYVLAGSGGRAALEQYF